jgi:hypothetical protein
MKHLATTEKTRPQIITKLSNYHQMFNQRSWSRLEHFSSIGDANHTLPQAQLHQILGAHHVLSNFVASLAFSQFNHIVKFLLFIDCLESLGPT